MPIFTLEHPNDVKGYRKNGLRKLKAAEHPGTFDNLYYAFARCIADHIAVADFAFASKLCKIMIPFVHANAHHICELNENSGGDSEFVALDAFEDTLRTCNFMHEVTFRTTTGKESAQRFGELNKTLARRAAFELLESILCDPSSHSYKTFASVLVGLSLSKGIK